MTWLINAKQVDKFRKSQKSLIIFDASYHGQDSDRNARQEFEEKHIPGAHFFDITLFKDLSESLLFDNQKVSEQLSALGIRKDFKIIFYDNSALHTSCYAVWLMKLFGHRSDQLYILNGGLSEWEKKLGKIETGKTNPTPKAYLATFNSKVTRSLQQIKENLQTRSEEIIDLRHPVNFAGGNAKPGLRAGHIPGSLALPFNVLFEDDVTFKSIEKIRKHFISIAFTMAKPVISISETAVTAAILDFILDILGSAAHSVYCGSWQEWGFDQPYANETSLKERPIENSLKELNPKERHIP